MVSDVIAIDRGGPGVLARALTRKTERFCAGLAAGEADILELVTPTTALLLRWWFGGDACHARTINFSPPQRQAILNTIVAHEVLGAVTLRSLYELVAPMMLAHGEHLLEIIRPRYFQPSYCVGAGPGSVLVLQALLIWQLLNKTAALRQGRDDSRFTQRFLLMAPHAAASTRLRAVFDNSQSTGPSAAARVALLMPETQREYLLDFWRNQRCDIEAAARCRSAAGMITIVERSFDLSPAALGAFAALPDLMVFDMPSLDAATEVRWQKTLTRIAINKGRRFLRMDFWPARHVMVEGVEWPAHVIAALGIAEPL